MFSQTTSFRNGCCNDSSAVMRFDGSNVSMRSNRSKASTGILGREETLIIVYCNICIQGGFSLITVILHF